MGLLDQFTQFAKTPEGQGLLSAAFGGLATAQRGAPLNSIGRAGLAGLAGYSGAIDREQQQADNAFQQQFKQAQLDELKRKQGESAKRDAWLQSFTNPGTTALEVGAQSGDVGPTVGNASRMNAIGRIPQQAIQADVMLNGGRNLPEWIFKTGSPDMQVSNGYAFDKNKVQPGFLPGISVSNDGKATLTQIGANGLPVISAPAGAIDAFTSYLTAQEKVKAQHDLVTVPTSNGTVRTMPRSDAIAATSGGGAGQAIPTKGNAKITPELLGLIQADAAKNGVGEPVINISSNTPGAVYTIAGNQVGVQQSPAEQAAAVEGAKNAAANTQAQQKDRQTARKFLNQAKFAEKLLSENPTGSGLGALRDKTLGFFGQTTPAAQAALQLDGIAGWLVNNVPRMEGPQSNFDVENYRTMAGKVGNREIPVPERLAALRVIQQMMQGVIDPASSEAQKQPKKVVRTGMYGGRKVVQYSDGSTAYAD